MEEFKEAPEQLTVPSTTQTSVQAPPQEQEAVQASEAAQSDDTARAPEAPQAEVQASAQRPLPPAVQAFQNFYLAELDDRIQRSEAVGAITLKKGSAALFYDPRDCKFTLVEKMPDVEAANVFDCVPREQWGRTVMLFGHATNTGGYIASGHGTLNGKVLTIKLATGRFYRIDVDSELPHLQPFFQEEKPRPPKEANAGPRKKLPPRGPKGPQGRRDFNEGDAPVQATDNESNDSHRDEESEDFTEEDLRRLRGELPLATKAKKKWRK